jgi:hypothetical protein
MRTKPGILILLLITIHTHAQQNLVKQSRVSPINSVSSVKYNGDSISINQMIIVKNKNLHAFITDLQKTSLSSSNKLGDMPRFVKSFLESFGNVNFTIAKPGQDWNCCCDQNDQLPNRQLICQGKSKNLYFISYLTGGFAETQHFVLIRYKNEIITDFWTGTLQGHLTTKPAIIKYLIKSKNEHYSLSI